MDIERLKKRKKELGLTNRQLAEKANISLGAVNKIFSGATECPRFDTIIALADAMDMNFYMAQELMTPDYVMEAASDYSGKKEGAYTIEDYLKLPSDVRVELIDGSFYTMEAPSINHQLILKNICLQLDQFIAGKKGPCIVLPAPVDVQLFRDDKNMVQPDVVILCDRAKTDGKRIYGAPDLVVEVVSMGSRTKDYRVKLNKYTDAGVREYWIVDMAKERIIVYQFAWEGRELDENISVHTFRDKVPVGIYNGEAEVDFSVISKQLL